MALFNLNCCGHLLKNWATFYSKILVTLAILLTHVQIINAGILKMHQRLK